jgi:hypothetical protein
MMSRDSQADVLVLVSSPFGPLALSQAALADALDRGRALMPSPATASPAAPEKLLTAEEIGEQTSTPASWWSEAARQGRVPCRWIGRYPRFSMAEVLACPEFRERS